jgi:hypothetical protein
MKSHTLKKGMRIMVYNDPRTKQKPEGIAILRTNIHLIDEPLQYWMVRFPCDPESFMRWIDPADVIITERK